MKYVKNYISFNKFENVFDISRKFSKIPIYRLEFMKILKNRSQSDITNKYI